MNLQLILWTAFTALVGLMLCVPENSNGKPEMEMFEQFWTQNPWVRIFYGLANILGVIFVLGMVGYLTFTQHWWYIAVFIGGIIVAKIVAFILELALYPIANNVGSPSPTIAMVQVKRITGSIIIYASIILWIVL